MSSSGLPSAEAWRKRSRELAAGFVRTALENLDTEYPHAAIGVESEDTPFLRPRERHPVFFGAYDWHSAVHNCWLLVHHLSLDLPDDLSGRAGEFLARRFTSANLGQEIGFLERLGNTGFERPYGLAWVLQLTTALRRCPVPAASGWLEPFLPVEQLAVERLTDYFTALSWPFRAGVHNNTAFAMRLSYLHACDTEHEELAEHIRAEAQRFFLEDRNYNSNFEPGGEDFLSPALCEVSLMAEILSASEFQDWFRAFLPDRYDEELSWLQPVEHFSESDGRMVHLAGLNFSRAWCLLGLIDSGRLGEALDVKWLMRADLLLQTGLGQLEAGGFRGRHWLPTFAALALQARLKLGDK